MFFIKPIYNTQKLFLLYRNIEKNLRKRFSIKFGRRLKETHRGPRVPAKPQRWPPRIR